MDFVEEIRSGAPSKCYLDDCEINIGNPIVGRMQEGSREPVMSSVRLPRLQMHWHLAQGADGRKHLDLTWEAKGTGVNHDPVFKEREQECGLLRYQERLRSRSAACRGVAVTVAVRCSTSATFQAFASDPLCAQDFCKLLVKCGFPKDRCHERG